MLMSAREHKARPPLMTLPDAFFVASLSALSLVLTALFVFWVRHGGSSSVVVSTLAAARADPYYYYDSIVIWPYERLYRMGPGFGNFGFWGGRSVTDICALMTGVGIEHWQRNTEDCEDLVHRQCRSHAVLLETVVYYWLLATSFLWSLRFLCRLRDKILDAALSRPRIKPSAAD